MEIREGDYIVRREYDGTITISKWDGNSWNDISFIAEDFELLAKLIRIVSE